jgi:hypothetical protein
LLHFAVLGAFILAIDHIITPTVDESRLITITPEVERELIAEFEKGRGRTPTPEELDEVIDAWVGDEVLYREGLALSLDRGDEMIRGRVHHKMRLLILNNLDIEPPTQDELRQWFEDHRHRYDRPKSFGFVLARVDGSVTNPRDRAQQAVLTINNGVETLADEAIPVSDAGPAPRPDIQVTAFPDRPRDSLVSVFGEAFVDALERQPLREWRAIEGKDGWYVVRLEQVKDSIEADFQALRSRIETEWLDQERRRLAREALREMRSNYVTQRETGS